MNIMFYPRRSNIAFGQKSSLSKPKGFQKEYDEIVLKSAKKDKQRNHRISVPSFINFHEKVASFVDEFADCGLTKKAYVNVIRRMPMIIACNPQSLINNVQGVVSEFEKENLTRKAYLRACLKQPVLILQKPETIERNIREVVKRYSESGLTTCDYLTMALKHPSLFSQSPESICKNIDTVVNRYKDSGLTTEAYLKALKRFPSVASLSPAGIEKNITTIVDKYSKYGLDESQYIRMLKFSPMGFCINSQNKIATIDKLIETLKDFGMTEEKCVKTFLRQPLIFFNNMETVTKRIEFLIFAESEKLLDQGIETKNKFQNLDNAIMKNLSYSTETNFILLLRDKLRYNCGESITYKHIKENMAEFIKDNASSSFDFKISQSEFTKDFIEFIDKYSKEIVGKNIFKICLR